MTAILKNETLAEQAFSAGDYSKAARLAKSDELRGCALVLVGALEEGLALIAQMPSARARYHAAFAYWGLNRVQEALPGLRALVSDPQFGQAARRLSAFIEQPVIRILFQGREDPACPDYDIVGALREIPYVDLITVGYSPLADIIINYQSTLDEVLEGLPKGWTPDFFVSHLLEDNPPPIGIENAPFPVIGHAQDYDRHIHHCYHYLPLMDAMIALGSADYDDLSKLSRVPTFVFPLLLGVDIANTRASGAAKDIDIFLSGTPFTNTHGKSKAIFDITQMPDRYRIVVNQGFLTPDAYFEALSRAKTTFTYVNRWGALNGRAVEALSVGTCALVQEGGEISLFLSEDEGAVPFNEHNHIQVLERVIEQWDTRYAQAARRGSEKVHRLFDFKKCARLYFHFLVNCVAWLDKPVKRALDPVFSNIRYPSRSPWRIRFHFPELASLMNLQDRFRQSLSASMEYAHQDALGESFLYSYITLEKSNFEQVEVGQSLLHVATITYQGLTETYPDRLAAWFNLGRLCFELNELQSAKAVFEAIQANPQLRYDANDILFWREFQDGLFDYDRMMEEMVNYRKAPDPKHLRQIEKLIRESVVYYQSNILLAEGKTADALAWLTQNMTPETEFVPSWTLRAILNLHAGRASEALADLKVALGRKEYILPKIGAEFFEAARNQGLEVSYYEQRLKRLMSRLVA